jgi:hypothetical protein
VAGECLICGLVRRPRLNKGIARRERREVTVRGVGDNGGDGCR